MRKTNWYFVLCVALPWLWLLGVTVAELARVLVVVGVGFVLWTRGKILLASHDADRFMTSSSSSYARTFWITAWAIVLIMTISSMLKVYLGDHGMDHAIFSQVVASIVNGQGFHVTFNRGYANNFLADHFSPILALPALLYWIGIPAALTFILLQGAALAGSLVAVRSIARLRGFSETGAALAALVFISMGDLRGQATWGTQLEYVAIPFTLFAWERYFRSKHWQSVFCLFLAAMCKETLLLWGGGFCLAIIAIEWSRTRKFEQQIIVPYLTAAVLLGVVFLAFTFGQKFFFNKNYDYMVRVDINSLLSPRILFEKLFYFLHFFIFVLFAPLFSSRGRLALLPLLPWFLIVAISNFSHMWEYGRQYVAFPAVLVFTAALVGLEFGRAKIGALSLSKLGALLLLIGFSFGLSRPSKAFVKFATKPALNGAELSFISNSKTVGVTWSSALFLLDNPNVYPIGAPQKFDYLVIARGEEEQLTKEIVGTMVRCRETASWLIYCPV